MCYYACESTPWAKVYAQDWNHHHAGERVVGMVDVTMARSHARERGEKERLVKSCLTNSSTQDEVEARRQNRFLVANGG